MVLDFDVVAGGLFVADLAAEVLLADALELVEALGPRRIAPLDQDEASDKLGLEIFEAPLAAVGLNEADDEEVVVSGVKDVEKEAGVVVAPVEQRRIHEGEDDAEASGVDDEVYLLSGAIGEEDAATLVVLDIGLGDDGAVGDVVG